MNDNKKYIVWVIWGEDACRKFDRSEKVLINTNQVDGYAKKYEFDTEAELNAFKFGVSECAGWYDSRMANEDQLEIRNDGVIENCSGIDAKK